MIKHGVASDTPITAIMEPTGMAWFPVAAWLQRAGITVIRVKGQRVSALRRYLSEHTKMDAADAHLLGAMPGFGSRGLDPVHVPSPAQHAVQRLTKQRHRPAPCLAAAAVLLDSERAPADGAARLQRHVSLVRGARDR
jgi:transposase